VVAHELARAALSLLGDLVNVVAHELARVATSMADFHICVVIFACIEEVFCQ
jgi:hypothetical protein